MHKRIPTITIHNTSTSPYFASHTIPLPYPVAVHAVMESSRSSAFKFAPRSCICPPWFLSSHHLEILLISVQISLDHKLAVTSTSETRHGIVTSTLPESRTRQPHQCRPTQVRRPLRDPPYHAVTSLLPAVLAGVDLAYALCVTYRGHRGTGRVVLPAAETKLRRRARGWFVASRTTR